MAIPEGEDGQTPSQQQQQLTPPSLKTDRPIQLRVVSQHAYVWDIEDVKRLRVDHHICGVLVGTLPPVAQQNIFLGLPLQLLPEEAAVLVAHGLAVLVNDNAAHARASVKQASAYAELRLQGVKEQQDLYIKQEKEKQAHMQAKYGAQIQKKREEKAEKRRKVAEAKLVDGLLGDVQTNTDGSASASASEQPDRGAEPVSGTSEAPLAASAYVHTGNQTITPKASTSKIGSIPNVPFSIITDTATSSSIHPWYHPEPQTLHSLEASSHVPSHSAFMQQVKSALFPFPIHSNGMQLARYKVFEDLWLKGYYMGKGLKFGGDYLCYPGDPLRFHSHFTAIVLESPKEEIFPLDIVSWGRLATAVKKACLLASWDNKAQKVRYLSLEWAGFG